MCKAHSFRGSVGRCFSGRINCCLIQFQSVQKLCCEPLTKDVEYSVELASCSHWYMYLESGEERGDDHDPQSLHVCHDVQVAQREVAGVTLYSRGTEDCHLHRKYSPI